MQLFNNKLLRSSLVYVLALIAVILIFGMWHNYAVKATTQYVFFIILIILILVFLSWLYFTIFKMSQELTDMINSTKQETSEIIEQEDNTGHEEQADVKNFDKDAFIAGIVPSEKKDLKEFCNEVLQNFAGKLNIVQGLFYIKANGQDTFESIARYAYYSETNPPVFKIGESIPGQAVKDNKVLIIQNIPESYIPVVSGLGNGKPKNIIIIPVVGVSEAVGLIELAVFSTVDPDMETALKELSVTIGKNLSKLLK